jgi:hypothetical protein
VRAEAWLFGTLAMFFLVIAPVYYVMSREIAGTIALLLTFFLALMVASYFGLIARRIDDRPEDKSRGEIAEGAGELGFFPPQSIWPLFCALTLVLVVLGPIFGWWLMILGFGVGALTLTGLVFEFYRGDHAH